MEGVYVVGGTVRDILIEEQGFDIDIAVEGDAIGLARKIARELGGRTREHESSGRPSWSTATTSAWTSSRHARSSTTR